MSAAAAVEPFRVEVPEADLEDLRERLARTRWPRPAPVPDWSQGIPVDYLREICEYWRTGFDWRAHEARLNAEPQFTAMIGGQRVHFVHVLAERSSELPLVLTNGWPSSFAELLPLAHRLAALGHDVVVPSLPGFTFSDPAPTEPARHPTHELWHQLMTGLGYQSYVAHGGDLGAGVTSRLGAAHPEAVAGLHLMAVIAAANHDMTAAAATLGLLYSLGLGVPKDADLSADWFRRAAQQSTDTAMMLPSDLPHD